MRSIRIFLISSILATLILFNFVAALHGYRSSMSEAETLFDNQLLDVSKLVSRLDLKKLDEKFRLGNNLAFQIWGKDNSLLAASFDAPEKAMKEFAPGFGYSNFNGYRWRTFSRYESVGNYWVMVAERSDMRFILAENVVLESIIPILLGIPLVGILIWIIISHGLKPLQELSLELKNKQAQDLSPIHYENSQKELEQMIRSTNGFIRRLSDTLEREKRFSADAAHELRTPVSALKIQLHNLNEEIGSNNESFQQLEKGVERVQHLIEQLLALYRVSPDQFSANLQEIDLHATIQNVIAQYYLSIENKHQTVALIGEPCVIQGDQFAIETLVSNLLSNANKYGKDGGKIIVRLEQNAESVWMSVEDNGPGLSEEDQLRVFDRFYRSGSGEDKSQIPGCGLGLTIVTHIADLHQARVSLEQSSFETGCTFNVCFNKNV